MVLSCMVSFLYNVYVNNMCPRKDHIRLKSFAREHKSKVTNYL